MGDEFVFQTIGRLYLENTRMQSSLKAAQQEIAKRDAQINTLQEQLRTLQSNESNREG